MHTGTDSQPHAIQEINGSALYRKISLRLIPYMFLLYILAYLDRVNVGYAAIQMKADLHLSDTVYGTGAGVFFLGSALFDIPSNLILARVGPRKWMARIMITWGIVAACMSLVHSPTSFYALRFMLGLSEAGFFPGMILYLTYWFPSRQRAKAVARFMTATAIAGVVGGPISSTLLGLTGVGGLRGWQWLFIAEGIPTMLFGISVLFLLNDHPSEAKWLSPPEREWLENEVQQDRKQLGSNKHHNFMDALKLPALYLLAIVFFGDQVCVYVINLWLPLFLNSMRGVSHLSGAAMDRWAVLPYLVTALAMVVVGWSSDRSNDRRFHVALCLLCSAFGFAMATRAHSLAEVLVAFSLATIGVFSLQGPFWTWLTSMLEGTAAAGGIAIITCLGGFGAFLGQVTVGHLSDRSHNYTSGLFTVAGVALVAAAAAICLRNGSGTSQAGPTAKTL
ncbi:MFS transporter [Acidipila sp. EB88]|uniref:MFS transporter n=1 Tax=Acidipila sp. EB88 TaxID=2305226 RepID=UPI000F5D7FA4|nr:MFS transporter [Acidipila sp. EB88]RRA50177.1 MFS transporter [Acidipila sp. EB88]